MLKKSLQENINLKKKLFKFEKTINDIIKKITFTLKNKGKILICGNGGSAADAQHLAAEFLVRLKPKPKRPPYPVVSLALDTSTITACSNDLGFNNLFSRNLEAIGKKEDLLIVISTSGNSKNILKVIKKAKKMNIQSVALLGSNGGKAKKLCDKEIIIPSKNTARIQECHIFLGHYIFEQVEKKLI